MLNDVKVASVIDEGVPVDFEVKQCSWFLTDAMYEVMLQGAAVTPGYGAKVEKTNDYLEEIRNLAAQMELTERVPNMIVASPEVRHELLKDSRLNTTGFAAMPNTLFGMELVASPLVAEGEAYLVEAQQPVFEQQKVPKVDWKNFHRKQREWDDYMNKQYPKRKETPKTEVQQLRDRVREVQEEGHQALAS